METARVDAQDFRVTLQKPGSQRIHKIAHSEAGLRTIIDNAHRKGQTILRIESRQVGLWQPLDSGQATIETATPAPEPLETTAAIRGPRRSPRSHAGSNRHGVRRLR